MMNHAPMRSLAIGVENGWRKRLDPRITARALRRLAELEDCYQCALKSAMRTVSKGSGIGAIPIIGAHFTMDYFGKYAVASMGCFGGCSIRDLATGFLMADVWSEIEEVGQGSYTALADILRFVRPQGSWWKD
jgi:hypothetical protein